VALPPATGARQLFALIAQDWRRIGVEAEAVAADASADLRLLDLVAPSAGAAWHLHRFSCAQSRACSAEADAALAAADEAPTLEARAERLAEADRLLARAQPFIVLATPLRWSLVAPNLTGYLDNPRAIHPLDQLRGDR
jgi:peptide/nickel transport system substrate-binding protein